MAPATPAKGTRTMATPRTTRSKVAAAHSNLSESSFPSTPGTSQAGKTAAKIPMTTGKMGLLGRKPSRLFADKETPVVKRMASFALPNLGSSKARVPSSSSSITSMSTEKNNVQAFLRLRPSPSSSGAGANAGNTKPYIEIQGDKQVTMKAPIDPTRPHVLRQTANYSFDRVFAPDAPQSDVFENTTLPMVEQVLHGQGGLLFSYGVSNSGKTYTMQGDVANGAKENLGMIPRAIQVVFDSIAGLSCELHVKPVRQAGVEFPMGDEQEQTLAIEVPAGNRELGGQVVKVDRNYSYAIFVSHVEVYNDKIFDLLESVPTGTSKALPKPTPNLSQIPRAIPRPGGFFSRNMLNSDSPRSLFHKSPFSSSFGSRPSLAAAASVNGGSGILTRQALAVKTDIDGGRYISGMKEIRVKTEEEALAVFMLGQEDRQVFGTLANRQSSRSHGVFTIKVVRIHNGAPNDPDSASVSRLCMVDLAGSERNDKSQAEGERLKEACNINKSLFALGTCLKTLRENQALMASRTLSTKRKPAHVSFKHVRLTEILESFFTGEGRVVMIVNVNPHDTGFQENSQVMEFSALATQIQTSTLDRLRQPIMKSFEAMKTKVQHGSGSIGRSQNKITVILPTIAPKREQSRSPLEPDVPEHPVEMVEEDLEVVEVDADDDEDVESDALVDALIDELVRTRMKLMQAEMLNALIEADIREEVVQEMHERLAESDERWRKRLQEEVQAHEEKTDRKIDIMQRRLTTAQGHQISAQEASEDEVEDDDECAEEFFASAVDISVDCSNVSLTDGGHGSPTPNHAKWPEMLVSDVDGSSSERKAKHPMANSGQLSPRVDRVYVEIVRQESVLRKATVDPQAPEEEADEMALSAPGTTMPLPAGFSATPIGTARPLDDVDADNHLSAEDDEVGSEEETESDEGFGSDDNDSEDDEDDDEEQDEEVVDNDSSFAVSNISISTVSSVPSTRVKRATKRKTSTYSRIPTALRSPTKEASQSPLAVTKRPARSRAGTKSPQKPAIHTPQAKSRAPLSESRSQSHVVISPLEHSPLMKNTEDTPSDGTPEQQVQASAIKKKRKLGKKVAMLDDGVGLRDEGQFTVRRMMANGRA